MKDLLATLRRLAKNDYYQALYSSAKELGFQLFQNSTDLTKIQLWFLSYMSMYASINMDVSLGEISDRVLENETYEDAYLVYKRRNGKEAKKQTNTKTSNTRVLPSTQWVFRKKKVE